jgi:L-2,4-diaminobutyrate decarboxylase
VPLSRRDELTDSLRERYNRSGRGFITATTLDKHRVLRIAVMNARTTDEHMQRLVDGLVAEGKNVLAHEGF